MTTTSDDPDFIEAISLIAAMEGLPSVQEDVMILSRLGMARAELTDYGHRIPKSLRPVVTGTLDEGMSMLSGLLDRMLAASKTLAHTLRLQAAQRILADHLASSNKS